MGEHKYLILSLVSSFYAVRLVWKGAPICSGYSTYRLILTKQNLLVTRIDLCLKQKKI